MPTERPVRVLVGKPGLDGHDVGAKIVSRALRDAGMEVVYSGLHRTPDEIVTTAMQEDVDVIGLSILSGAHLPIAQKVLQKLKEKGIDDVPIIIGGVIPKRDATKLKEYGIAEVRGFGSSLDEIVETVSRLAKSRHPS